MNFPASHAVQGPPSGPEKPALQTQCEDEVLPGVEEEDGGQLEQASDEEDPSSVEYVFAEQSLHAPLPVCALYFPGAQTTHRPPSSAVVPGLHLQADNPVLPGLELALAGQSLQSDSEATPVCVEYFPATHRVHEALPMFALYVPGRQSVHGPPLYPVEPELHVHDDTPYMPGSE